MSRIVAITRPELPADAENLTVRREGGRLVGTLTRGRSLICRFAVSLSQERAIRAGDDA